MSESTPISRQRAESLRNNLERALFSDPKLSAYAVLDGAANPALLDHLYADGPRPEFECLYRGQLEPDIAECAPYIARLEPDSPFCDWVIGNCWGNHWGIFALSKTDLRALRQHFRKLNMVYDAGTNKPLLLRYYDPRVLRLFLSTCDEEQFAEFFGPVEAFFAESEFGETVEHFYRHQRGNTRKEID